MKREKAVEVLEQIASPIVGRFLGERVAQRLYDVLSALDKETIDALLSKATRPLEPQGS
jgi:hypothetical protein